MKSIHLFIAALLVCWSINAQHDEIRPYPGNSTYWQYKGKPMLLLGGSDDDNLFQWTGERLEAQLDALTAAGGNYLRCTMSYRDEGNVKPWVELENGRYDLDRFNDTFWQRFATFLEKCDSRDIIVQVEVWATYDYLTRWEQSPFCPPNNINYASGETSLPDRFDPGAWPGEHDCPFYHTVPDRNNDPQVLAYQQAFVDRLLEISLKHDNVLYCIDNEIWFSAPLEWGEYWSRYIRKTAGEAEKKVYITEMHCHAGFDLRYGESGAEQIKSLLAHPELWDYLDVSNIGMFNGEYFFRQIYEVFLHTSGEAPPRPVNFVKIYGNPEAGYDLATAGGGPENFWIALTSGMASVRFHRPPTGLGINPVARAHIRSARMFSELVKPWECSPMMELTSDNYQNEAYLIARPGIVYGIYFPNTELDGKINVDLRGAEGSWMVKWMDPDRGEWIRGPEMAGGKWQPLTIPEGKTEHGWVAVILPAGDL